MRKITPMSSALQPIEISDSNFSDALLNQAKKQGLQAIQPAINKLLTSIPKKIKCTTSLLNFLSSWGKTFDSFVKQYDNLNRKRDNQIAKAFINLGATVNNINMSLFNVVKTTEQIRYLIKAMYDAVQIFEKEFNININYGIFIGPLESASGNIEVQIKNIDADILNEAANYNYSDENGKAILRSYINLAATRQSKDKTIFKNNNDAVKSFQIPFSSPSEGVTNKKNMADEWLKIINTYWNDAIRYINPRLKKDRDLDQLFAPYIYSGSKNGKNQEGVLGEGAIKAFLLKEHLGLIESKYSEYIECHNKGKKAKILGGPKYSKIINTLKSIMKPDKDIYFATGDFDYREVWDALKDNQIIIHDLTETSFSNISSDQMKQLYGIYKNYINQQIQIKKGNATISGYATINLCRTLAWNLTNEGFLQLVENKTAKQFEEALRISTGSSAQEFMDALQKNLQNQKI